MDTRRKANNNNLVEYLESLTDNIHTVENGVELIINETVRRETN